jgi:hypothetical protein
MSVVINGTTGITNDGGYTGDGVVFADTTPANTLVTTTGGNVGIGTSSPSTRFEANTGAGGTQNIATIRSSNVQLKIGTTDVGNGEVTYNAFPTSNSSAAGAHVWQSGGTERARIDSSGSWLVATTSSSIHNSTTRGLAYNPVSWLSITSQNESLLLTPQVAGGVARFYLANTGEKGSISISSGGVSYNTSSDYRLKHDIAPMTGALEKVAALKPVTYRWNADGSDGQGFIAHELQEVVPDAVVGKKDAVDAEGNPQYQGIDTSFLVATLTAAIQEQQAIITDQDVKMGQLVDQLTNAESTMNLLTEMFTESQQTVAALTARVEALEGKANV